MAMDASILGKKIADRITDADAPASYKAMILDMWLDISEEIVKHIQDNAVVQSGIPVSTTGTATAQTGATTGTGTIK